MSDTACSWATGARGQQSLGVFNQLQFTALGFNSDPSRARFPIYRQNIKFPAPRIGKADTHGKQACIQIPMLSDAAKSETASVMCLTEGSHYHRTEQACSRDGESRPAGCWGSWIRTELWQPTVAPGPGEGWALWPALSPHSLYIWPALLSPSLPSLPLALLLSLSYLYVILFREARCCFTGYVSAIKIHSV